MPKKPKLSDEQLLEMLKDPQYKTNKQIVDALGVTSYTTLNNRLNKLRKEHGLPPSSGRKKKAEPVGNNDPAGNVKPVDISSPPEKEAIKWDDVKPNDRLLRNERPIKVLSIDSETMIIEDRFGLNGVIKRKYFEDNPQKFAWGKARMAKAKAQTEKNLLESRPPTDSGVDNEKKTDEPAQLEPKSDKQNISIAESIFRAAKKEKTASEDSIAPEWKFDLKREESIKKKPCSYFLKDCDFQDSVSICEKCPDYITAIEELEKEWAAAINTDTAADKSYRDYLAKVDRLFSLMAPLCLDNKLLRIDVMNLAHSILDLGFTAEINRIALQVKYGSD